MIKLLRSLVLVHVVAFAMIISSCDADAQEKPDTSGTDPGEWEISTEQNDADSVAEKLRNSSGPFDLPSWGPNQPTEGTGEDEIDLSTLTGMQLFEPKDLKLTGIMLSGSIKIAMVEDASKRGHTLKEGDKIGRRGVVTKIEQDRVIITETRRKSSGVLDKTTITMQMNTKGEF